MNNLLARLAYLKSKEVELAPVLDKPFLGLPNITVRNVIANAFDYSEASVDWFCGAGDDRLFDFPLSPGSVIFDVGGYNGDWAQKAINKFDHSIIHTFEPDPTSLNTLRSRFTGLPGVHIHPYGLSNSTRRAEFNQCGMGSSLHSTTTLKIEDFPEKDRKVMEEAVRKNLPNFINVDLKDIAEVISDGNIGHIDLVKINIEGEEYALLQRMLDANLMGKIDFLEVQFHEWFKHSHKLRDALRLQLNQTHKVRWTFPFVWEAWERR